MTDEEKPFSPAMMSALLAVSRMKGDSTMPWLLLLAEEQADDRRCPAATDAAW